MSAKNYVIEIQDFAIKVYAGSAGDKNASVSAMEIVSLKTPSGGSKDFALALEEITLLKNAKKAAVTLVLPRRQVLLKRLRLPSSDPVEIRQMAALQLPKQIPYALEDVFYDTYVIRQDSSGYTDVEAVVVQQDLLRQYLDAFESVSVSVVGFSSLGSHYWFVFQQTRGFLQTRSVAAVVDLDQDSTEICFCAEGSLLFSRFFPVGAADIHKDGPDKWLDQIRKTLNIFEHEHLGPSVSHIFCVSALTSLDQARELLHERTGLPVDMVHPLANLDAKRFKAAEEAAANQRISPVAGVGFFLRPPKDSFNLAPKEIFEKQKSRQQMKEALVCVLLVMVLGAVLFFSLWLEADQKAQRMAALESQIQEVKPGVQELARKRDVVDRVESDWADKVFLADVMKEFYEFFPADMSMRSLTMEENGDLVVQGYAAERSGVNRLQSKMIDSKIFDAVNLQFTTKRKIGNRELVDFKISARVVGGGDG